MKLQCINVILVLGVMGLAGMADSLCLVRNTTEQNEYWYQCFRSNDYSADLKRSPTDIFLHTVTNSKIRVIRDGSYARLGRSLSTLVIAYSGVEEIEDNAFQGLYKLKKLGLMGNKLEIIRSVWFEGLSGLKRLSFENNRIKRVDDNFFSILPPLNVIDISNNQLTCLPIASFGNFKALDFHMRHNRFTWACQVSIIDWLKKNDIWVDHSNLGNMDPPYDLAKICANKLPGSRLDEEFMKKCVEETVHQLLPAKGEYTVGQVCEFLKGKHSPFLDCTK